MSFSSRTRYVNPRLGAYFGIFASTFAAFFLMALIFEQLGVSDYSLSLLALSGPVLLYAAIGMAAFTREPLEFFAAGRRVPAIYAGLGMAMTALGATGLVALPGIFFLIGFDALCIVIGGLAGFVIMAVLLAPFLRKFGAFTLPTYLGRRFDSRPLRVTAAVLFAVPMLLLLAAELRMGAYVVTLLTGQAYQSTLLLLGFVLVLALALGGMRSMTWSSVAESIAALLALMVPVATVAIIVTNLPIPQLTTGPLLRALGRSEAIQSVPIVLPPLLAFDIPGEGYQAIAKRFTAPFGNVGSLAFAIVTLTTMAGVAAAPWLLPRVATTPGVYEARKSIGWATVIFGIVMLTVSSVAIFMRDYILDLAMIDGPAVAPDWLTILSSLGYVQVDQSVQRYTYTSFTFNRDDVLFSLPVAAGMPAVMLNLALAGAVAASLAAAGAVLVALGNVLAEDVVCGLSWEPPAPGLRLMIARVAMGLVAALGVAFNLLAPTDPVRLLLWALALTGSAVFPVLVLSIWWKRINSFGALAGVACGFAVAVLAIIAGEARWFALDGAMAGAFGIPAATIAAIAVSLATTSPSRHVMELVRDIRVPGGEILYDREMRLSRSKQRQRI